MRERLKILQESAVIDEEVYVSCLELHEGLMADEALTRTNAYQVALTHLAMALQRIKQDNIVTGMDEAILSEIVADSLFEAVKELTDTVVKQLGNDIPDPEVQFLWLHFLTVLKEKGGE